MTTPTIIANSTRPLPRAVADARFKSTSVGVDVERMSTVTRPPLRRTIDGRRPDAGSTFQEVLIAIVLMGFAFSAIIAGIRTVIVVSSLNDDQSKVDAVLNSASDRLANWAYRPCPGPNGEGYAPVVEAAAAAVDGSAQGTVQIIDVDYWDPSLNAPDPNHVIDADGGWVDSNSLAGNDCNEDISLTTSRTLQRITIQVTSPSGKVTRCLEVVKSNVISDPEFGTSSTTTTTPSI